MVDERFIGEVKRMVCSPSSVPANHKRMVIDHPFVFGAPLPNRSVP